MSSVIKSPNHSQPQLNLLIACYKKIKGGEKTSIVTVFTEIHESEFPPVIPSSTQRKNYFLAR